MRVSHLRLSDFRNHADLTLDFSGRSVVLIGQNGIGKTNVLEALSPARPRPRLPPGDPRRDGPSRWLRRLFRAGRR